MFFVLDSITQSFFLFDSYDYISFKNKITVSVQTFFSSSTTLDFGAWYSEAICRRTSGGYGLNLRSRCLSNCRTTVSTENRRSGPLS
jgi:hypothetical protein